MVRPLLLTVWATNERHSGDTESDPRAGCRQSDARRHIGNTEFPESVMDADRRARGVAAHRDGVIAPRFSGSTFDP